MEKIFDANRFRVLSGSAIKMIALAVMILDHIGASLLIKAPFANQTLFSVFSHNITLYWIVRAVGRLAFPMYCFLLTEGFRYTRSREKYGVNLLLFALISEIPWNLEHSGRFFYKTQNVFFTLFLGFLAMYFYEKYRNDQRKMFFSLLAIFVVSIVLRSDYGSKGVGFILFLYMMKDHRAVRDIVGSCFLSNPGIVIFSFVPIEMYNSKRGFIRTKAAKYLFYAAYPVHILILYFIRNAVYGY